MSLESRLTKAEKIVGILDAPKSYEWHQLVHAAEYVNQGLTEEEALRRVGPPERPIVPGQPTFEELLSELPDAP